MFLTSPGSRGALPNYSIMVCRYPCVVLPRMPALPYCIVCVVAYLELFVHVVRVAFSSCFVCRRLQEREAELALSLLHPNIVRCLGTLPSGRGKGKHIGAGIGGDVGFLIFEHIPGTLLDLIQGCPGGLSFPEVGASSECPAGIDSCSHRHSEVYIQGAVGAIDPRGSHSYANNL